MVGLRYGAAFAQVIQHRFRQLRLSGNEAGFTLLEVLLAGLMLVIIAAPLSAVLATSSTIGGQARERTAADQLAQTAIETMRSLSYTQVGIVNGNPPGVLAATTSTTLPSGEAVTLNTDVSWVADPIPGAYVTNADYKKVVMTLTRNSDGRVLTTKTSYVASASAPPLSGTGWVQIKRTVVDAVTQTPIVGATVTLTGGPNSENRNDTSDAAGVVDFPALSSSAIIPPPNYSLATVFSPYLIFPDDISPGPASLIPATPGLSSTTTMRMYQPGVSLVVNVQTNTGTAYTGGATISLDSSRCGLQTVSIASGSSSTTITNCNYATGKNVPLVPNVTGQTPLFDKYFVTAWSNSGSFWGATPSTGVTVPSAYPTTMTQTVNVKFSATTYPTTKSVTVTVTKSGVGVDSNARVEITGGPVGVTPIYLYGTTNGSGQATFTIPVTSAAATFTVNANDMGTAKGTTTFSATTGTSSPIASAVTIS
jgi:type II secretory pathway pseudopilin PulG